MFYVQKYEKVFSPQIWSKNVARNIYLYELTPPPQFLVRRGQICSIAKEDPHGIVHEVQPVGSYFWDGTKMCPLSQEILFVVRRLQIQRSAKIPTMGSTKAYDPLSGLFVSGSRCLPYHNKLV